MLSIGLGELIVILMVALIVVGPADLPKVARTIAKAVKWVNKIAREIKDLLLQDEDLRELAEINDTIKEDLKQNNPIRFITEEVNDVTKVINDSGNDLTKEILDVKLKLKQKTNT